MYFQAKDYSPVPTGTKVAFIGLGTMGFPMAGHLLHAGCQVTVYNRTAVSYTHLNISPLTRI